MTAETKVNNETTTEVNEIKPIQSKKNKKTINWPRVWYLCSPFFTVLITFWIWKIFLFPSQSEITRTMNVRSAAENRLITENRRLREQYSELWHEAHFLAGENFALNRSFDKLAGLSLQQAIAESGEIHKTSAKSN